MNNFPQLLQNLGLKSLNTMQQEVLETYGGHKDMILYAPTGSGKTLAYLFSVLKSLPEENGKLQVVIIAPVRELALQIDTVFRKLSTGIRITCVYGGHSMREETRSLEVTPTMLVGTPGRILDLIHRQIIDVRQVHTLVLDEFDKSLELGFEGEMESITRQLKSLQKKLFTSATVIRSFPEFLSPDQAVTFNFLGEENAIRTRSFLTRTKDTEKMQTAFHLACSFQQETAIFFCNHRETVNRLSAYFNERQLKHSVFHGGLEQEDREKALIRFRNGTCTVLISTDLAARGIDIDDIRHVVHFQMSLDENSMTHRNGRTARAGKDGEIHFILSEKEFIPDYFSNPVIENNPDSRLNKPFEPVWETLYFDLGKKDKINKIDLVGFLCQSAKLEKSEIGLITVSDRRSFVAVKRKKINAVLSLIQGQKIKKKQVRIRIAD